MMSSRIAGVCVMLCFALLPCCVGAQSDKVTQATEPPQVVQSGGDVSSQDAAAKQEPAKAEESAQARGPNETEKTGRGRSTE